jgi:glycine hydroxymethyltransferase
MPQLAEFLARGLEPACDPATIAADVTAWRAQFTGIHFTADDRAGCGSAGIGAGFSG